jgi:signal transduction histidine kinase
MKWISALLTTLFIAIFEFIRHQFLQFISMEWGNLLVAGLAGVLFFLYFHGVFALLETLYNKLQKEKEETAVLQERYRIARELHDSVSQALFFMNIKVMEIETALHQQREPLLAVKDLKEAIKLTDADIRQHIFALQKVTRENINLVSAIQQYICNYEEQNNITVNLSIEGEINTKLSPNVKNQLLQIFKELLINIRKHAEAKQVSVSLVEKDQRFSMTICDDGRGFNIENIKANSSSFGYKILEEDVREIGAKLKLRSFPGQGTTVAVSVDLE